MDAGKDFLEKIETLVQDSYTVTVDGKTYSAKPLEAVRDEPLAREFGVTSLTGFVDYINKQRAKDEASDGETFVHIQNETHLQLISKIKGDGRRRECLLTCTLNRGFEAYPFDDWLSQETFIIKLLSLFQESDDRAYLLSYASAIRDDTEVHTTDDGVTQRVTAKAGVSGALVKETETKPIVSLKPFRTFREVDQPESKFLFRVRKTDDGPRFALFEADGGAWKLDAIARIKAFLMRDIEQKDIAILA